MTWNYSSLLRYVLGGVGLGLALTALRPAPYVASTTLYFPGTQTQSLAKLTQALKAQPDSLDVSAGMHEQTSVEDPSPVARLILLSQPAWEAAWLKQSEDHSFVSARDRQRLKQRLSVTAPAASTLSVEVQGSSASQATALTQGLLEYYRAFLKQNPLSRVAKTKKDLDQQLTAVRKQLAELEEKMSHSRFSDLRGLGGATTKVDPKTMSQVWLRRADETRQTQDLLNRLQKLRVKTSDPDSQKDEVWLRQWAAARKVDVKISKQLLDAPTSRQELLGRLKLERTYYEALLRHRALVLQQAFLATWQQLESFDYEIIVPTTVATRSKNYALNALYGALVGLMVGLFASRRSERRMADIHG